MEILKRFGCRVLAPLLLTAAGLLMIVVVPMNASQFLAENEAEVQDSKIELDSELYQPKGLIYLNVQKAADTEIVIPENGWNENSSSR